MSDVEPKRNFIFPDYDSRESTFLGDLFRKETVGGGVALVAAAIAVIWANSPWGDIYEALRDYHIGPLSIEHWAADGALTVFFFVAGLELKREFVLGSLRKPADAAVPITAAICGVMMPALIYLVINLGSEAGQPRGWAIPAATDIAFALAVLAVVGSNLPSSVRAFLLTLAVVDDLIVIVIIAIFYTETLHVTSLMIALATFAAWYAGQRLNVRTPVYYIPIALIGWWFLHESGIHATIAGVAFGLLTTCTRDENDESTAEYLEHLLSPLSAAVAVPFFALMSAGVAIKGGGELIRDPVVIGVVLGLVLGKPVGVLAGAFIVTRITHAELNAEISWRDIIGVAILAGVGFTVSLLVCDLSFGREEGEAAKTAVLAGSLMAAVLGALALGHRDRFHATP